jgi:ribonuclease P protein component
MLPKRERLGRKDFEAFFRSGRRRHSAYFTLVAAPSPAFHAAVVVPKKVAARAVERNRLRRRLYDLLRHGDARNAGGIYIVLVKAPARAASYAALKDELKRLLTNDTQR